MNIGHHASLYTCFFCARDHLDKGAGPDQLPRGAGWFRLPENLASALPDWLQQFKKTSFPCCLQCQQRGIAELVEEIRLYAIDLKEAGDEN